MTYSHRFSGRVVRSMISGHPYLSTTTIFSSMYTYNDFLACSMLKGPSTDTEFLLTYDEKNALLKKIVTSAFASLKPLEFCLMTAMQPSSTPFPERLLRSDIFLCESLAQERARLLSVGVPFVSIDERLVRSPREHGDNCIDIEWVVPQAQDDMFSQFVLSLAEYGIAPISDHVGN